MKFRLVAFITIVALGITLAFVASRLAMMRDVSADDFSEIVRNQEASKVVAYQTSSAAPLPMLLSVRFPESDQKSGLGFPDRTEIYTFATSSGQFECFAHIRRGQVCLVTFGNSAPPIEFRELLASEFPQLSIR